MALCSLLCVCLLCPYKAKNTNKYGVRRFTVNILVSTQVNVDSFFEKTFSATFKIVNYYPFVKGEYFINKKGF